MPIRTDQFISILLSLKADKLCKEYLFISAYNKNMDNKMSFFKSSKNFQYLFNDLDIESNIFNGIALYTKDSSININIEKIELIENSNALNTEFFLGNIKNFDSSNSSRYT